MHDPALFLSVQIALVPQGVGLQGNLGSSVTAEKLIIFFKKFLKIYSYISQAINNSYVLKYNPSTDHLRNLRHIDIQFGDYEPYIGYKDHTIQNMDLCICCFDMLNMEDNLDQYCIQVYSKEEHQSYQRCRYRQVCYFELCTRHLDHKEMVNMAQA